MRLEACFAVETAIEGCLGGSTGNYNVTDKSGTSYTLQFPDNSKNAVLDKHIGQEVRVNGTVYATAIRHCGIMGCLRCCETLAEKHVRGYNVITHEVYQK